MALDQEIKYFQQHRDDLVKTYRNLYVLVKGQEVLGAYPDAESAYADGLGKLGFEPFLVKQVLAEEPLSVVPIYSVKPYANL